MLMTLKKGAVTKHPRKVLVEEAKNPVLHCREERDFLRLPFPGDFMLLVGLFPGLSCPTFGHFPYIMSNGVQAPLRFDLFPSAQQESSHSVIPESAE